MATGTQHVGETQAEGMQGGAMSTCLLGWEAAAAVRITKSLITVHGFL